MESAKKNSGAPLILMILIIILLVAGILVATYLWMDAKKVIDNKESEITKLNESVANLKEEVEKLKNENGKDNDNDEKPNTTNEKDIVDLLKNGGEYDYLRISSIIEENDKYLATASYYVPITITEEEYEDMLEEETITIEDTEYLFEKEENEKLASYGYGYIYKENQEVYSGYCVYKTDDGYIFLRDVGGVPITIDEEEKEISFYLDSETVVAEITVGESTLAEYLSENKENYKVDKYKMTVVYDEDEIISLEADKR